MITHSEQLSDGRFNIILRGMEKFRVVAEDDTLPYRVAHVESVREPPPESFRDAMQGARRRLESLLVPQPVGRAEPKMPAAMPDEELVNAIAQYMEFEPVEKQALLEREGLLERCHSLIELLEMKVIVARHPWDKVVN